MMQLTEPSPPTSDASSPSPSLTKHSSILIIGAGAWGSSTALHLSRRGYTNITVLDSHLLPSPISASNDINKICELSSSVPQGSIERYVSDYLARDAMHGWLHDPIYCDFYHDTGAVTAASSPQGLEALTSGDGYTIADGWTPLNTASDFQDSMPHGLLTGEFPNWKGYTKKDGCGWVEARNALLSTINEATRLGVEFITGEKGEVTSLINEDDDVKGAIVKSGQSHRADYTILCAGANAPFIFDMEDQLRPTAWTLAHIKLTRSEAEMFKNAPVLFHIERGFFMPNADEDELKICDEHPGYCNRETQSPISGSIDTKISAETTTSSSTVDPKTTTTSIPFSKHQIPLEAELRIRSFLRDVTPQFADRPFTFARICWCADTVDRAFLITRHPKWNNLVLGVGGSGHGFSYIPTIGAVIADCLEGKMDDKVQERFKWRPEMAVKRNWEDVQGRFGPEGSNHVMNLREVKEWTMIVY